MSSYDSLMRQKRNTNSRMYAAQDANSDLQEQIERLKAAKETISAEKSEYYSVKLDVQKIAYGFYQWKGDTFDSFSDEAQDLVSHSNEYYLKIDDAIDSINSKITELKNRMEENNDIIGWCRSRLRDIGTMLENLFN